MGCHHSKVKEQVNETTAAPVAEQPSDLVVHSTETVDVVVQTKPEETEVAEVKAEEVVVEQVKEEEAPAAPVDAVVEEKPVAEAVEVVEEAKEVVEEAAVEEPKKEEEAAPVVEEPAAVVEEAVPEEKVTEEAVAEPEAEEKPLVPEVTGAISFECAGVTFGERHVAFYGFKGTDKEDPSKEITLSKRYNDFKALHAAMEKVMASENNVPAEESDKFQTYPALPALPKAGLGSFVKGRRNQGLTDAREVQFKSILNAIARHPVAYQSAEFQAFLA